MTDLSQQQVLGHLLGALEDDEQEWVDSQLEQDEEYRQQWLLWRRRVAPLETARVDFEPPPGLAERTCRLVAAWSPMRAAKAATLRSKFRMSPDGAFYSAASHVGQFDVAVLILLALTMTALVFPAIQGSRSQARVAACQAKMQQLGSGLADYGHQYRESLPQLADSGRLTVAGVAAAGWVENNVASAGGKPLISDAWLAAQGERSSSVRIRPVSNLRPESNAGIQRLEVALCGLGPRFHRGARSQGVDDSANDWSGTWRNGTQDDAQEQTLPAAQPLLADAPSADLPGQPLDYHDGRGRNLFFADGHISFLPNATPTDAIDVFLSSDGRATTRDVSAPITLVNWR